MASIVPVPQLFKVGDWVRPIITIGENDDIIREPAYYKIISEGYTRTMRTNTFCIEWFNEQKKYEQYGECDKRVFGIEDRPILSKPPVGAKVQWPLRPRRPLQADTALCWTLSAFYPRGTSPSIHP